MATRWHKSCVLGDVFDLSNGFDDFGFIFNVGIGRLFGMEAWVVEAHDTALSFKMDAMGSVGLSADPHENISASGIDIGDQGRRSGRGDEISAPDDSRGGSRGLWC